MTPSLLQSEAIERLFARSNGSPEYEVWAGPPTARRRAVAADLKSLLAYITQLEGEAEAGRKAVEALRGGLNVACEEIYDLRRYANNHGGMIDCEKFTEGLAALAALPPSQGGDAG
jgi:hypothetical protein